MRRGAYTSLRMEVLKTCSLCGRFIDKTFRFCPYCGYDFRRPESVPLETGAAPAAEAVDCSQRIHAMEQTLSRIEEELDLLLLSKGAG
jgi:hypothetical protein